MQLSNTFTLLALAIVGSVAMAHPPTPPPPPPPPAPPVINHQVNYCSSGAPYCCSPSNTDGGGKVGTTCVLSTTSCNSVSICCNNAQNGDGTASQGCIVSTSYGEFPATQTLSSSTQTFSSPIQTLSSPATTTSSSVANTLPPTSRTSLAPLPSHSRSQSSLLSTNWILGLLSSLAFLFV